jgi:hypothetical protein
MTLAIAQLTHPQPLSFNEFLARSGGDNRYERIEEDRFEEDR